MITRSQVKGCRRSLPNVPYAIPLNYRNARITPKVDSPATSALSHDWSLVIVVAGTIFLAFATTVGLMWALRRGGRAEESAHAMPAKLSLASPTSQTLLSEPPASIQSPDEEAPRLPPAQQETVVHAMAVSGSPVGAGKIEMLLADDRCPLWNAELPLRVDDPQQRIRFPAIELVARETNGDSSHRIRHAIVYFLFVGAAPLTVQVTSPGSTWAESCTIRPQESDIEWKDTLGRWSHAYGRNAKEVSGPAGFLRQMTLRVLARRLSLGEQPFPSGVLKERPMAALESTFERSLSTLLGIDSLLLAVPEIADTGAPPSLDKAALPLPPPLNLPAVQIPEPVRDWPAEKLALQVPHDCFYVRCRRVGNLAWMRGFLTAWGGNLHDIVSVPVLDYAVRARLEEQLALGLARSQTLGIDESIADMALIGADFYFQEGAAVGVVFQASNAPKLRSIVQQQRGEAKRRYANAQQTTLNVEGFTVDALATADHAVRSFYAIKDQYHIVTNSLSLLKQFLAIQDGRGSLGRLDEFRYVRARETDKEQYRVLIYLSDPFFRRLSGPHYRIELMRRARSLADMHELAVAAAVATSLGQDDATTAALVRAAYLPAAFEDRADDSQLGVADGHVVDSLRGRRGTFLPIPDVPLKTATHDELNAYQGFVQRVPAAMGARRSVGGHAGLAAGCWRPAGKSAPADLDHASCAAALCVSRTPSGGRDNRTRATGRRRSATGRCGSAERRRRDVPGPPRPAGPARRISH